jgi:UV DNA damage endonuclease
MWDTPIIFQTPENPPNIRLGLCCINSSLRHQKVPVFCSRSMIRKTYTLEKANLLAQQNLADLMTLLIWNNDNGIKHFRLSSDMFPRITDETIPQCERLKISTYVELLKDIGAYAKATGQRLTMHPGQYNQIGAYDPEVFRRTVEDLTVHAAILDAMGLDNNAIITIHGGGVYGDKEETIKRWVKQFYTLPKNVQARIAIENCERQYNVEDCLDISKACNIPVILDSHHFDCYNLINNANFVAKNYIAYVLASWGDRRAVMHISEQKPDSRVGSHSDFIENIPQYMLDIPSEYGVGVDIEVEAKAKEAAIFKLRDKYKI